MKQMLLPQVSPKLHPDKKQPKNHNLTVYEKFPRVLRTGFFFTPDD